MLLRRSLCVALLVAGAAEAWAQVLLDPATGSRPEDQGWTVFAPPPLTASVTDGRFALDSRPAGNAGRGGLSRQAPVALNREHGFSLAFALRVVAESHQSPHRSGVSVIVLADDHRGIELGFWEDSIWAQSELPLFNHAEGASIDTTEEAVPYTLTLESDRYTLVARNLPLLSGPVRDYSAFSGLLDVYEIPNFLFFGDDTTSAAGAMELGLVELIPPIPPPLTLLRTPSDATLELAWPATGFSWTLEAAARVGPDASWQAVMDPPETSAGFHRVVVPVPDAVRFFRLRR